MGYSKIILKENLIVIQAYSRKQTNKMSNKQPKLPPKESGEKKRTNSNSKLEGKKL